MASGNHPDLEVLAPEPQQRQLSIDRVRALSESLALTGGIRRVALLLGADVLTEEAANALLMLLEEPPPGAHLILTAASVDGVKETLVSRCRVLRVPPAGVAATRRFLEERGVDPERATRAAILSEGRPGPALDLTRQPGDHPLFHPLLAGFLQPEGAANPAHEILQELRGDGAVPEEQRQALRQIGGLALVVFSRAARVRRGGGTAEDRALLALVPGVAELSAPALEHRLVSLVRALADVDRNVALDLLLAALFASWQAER